MSLWCKFKTLQESTYTKSAYDEESINKNTYINTPINYTNALLIEKEAINNLNIIFKIEDFSEQHFYAIVDQNVDCDKKIGELLTNAFLEKSNNKRKVK